MLFTMPPSGDPPRADILPGTLELIVLRILTAMGPQHAYGIAARIEQVSDNSVHLNQVSLYPALVRLEQKGWIESDWQQTENNRRAKYYQLTAAGRKAVGAETASWRRYVAAGGPGAGDRRQEALVVNVTRGRLREDRARRR